MFEKRKARKVQAEHRGHVIEELRARADQLPESDGPDVAEAFGALGRWATAQGIVLSDVPDVQTKVIVRMAKCGYCWAATTSLLLKPGEVALWDVRSNLWGTAGTTQAEIDSGTLTLTNRRLVYHSARSTLEFPFASLTTLDVYSGTIVLGVTGRVNTLTFAPACDPEVVAGLTRAAMDHQGSEFTIIPGHLDMSLRQS